MSKVGKGSASGTLQVKPQVKLTNEKTLESTLTTSKVKDAEGDVKMLDQVKNLKLTERKVVAKVAPLPKFKGILSKLKEFLAKLKIYLNYNKDDFEDKANKVLFVILYLEEGAFDFIKVYLNNYNENSYKDQKLET